MIIVPVSSGNVIVLSAEGSAACKIVSLVLSVAPSKAINWFWANTILEPNTVNPVDEVILLEPVGLIVVTPAIKGLLTVKASLIIMVVEYKLN